MRSFPFTFIVSAVGIMFGSTTLSLAQNLALKSLRVAWDTDNRGSDSSGCDSTGFTLNHSLRQLAPGIYQVPEIKSPARPLPPPPVFVVQDCLTLTGNGGPPMAASIAEFGLPRNPPPFSQLARNNDSSLAGLFAKDIQTGLSLVWALYRPAGGAAENHGGCEAIAVSVTRLIQQQPASILEIVEREVSANVGCACEIVKAAIRVSEADSKLVADIVEVAIMAAPETLRIVSQCAIAISPESLSEIQAVLAKLDPGSGDGGSGAKSAKSAKSAKGELASDISEQASSLTDPLDLPPSPPRLTPPVIPSQVTLGGPTNP
jgi:hypothetical protein